MIGILFWLALGHAVADELAFTMDVGVLPTLPEMAWSMFRLFYPFSVCGDLVRDAKTI